MEPKRIGLIGFDGVASVDLSGPAEAFSRVTVSHGDADRIAGYEVVILAQSNRQLVADSGLIFKPHTTFERAPSLDTMIIPGGMSLRHPAINDPISTFVRERAPQTR